LRSTPAPVGPLGRERHEVASTSSVGIWFEVILMQLMVRDIYDQDPRSRRTQYALSEIADECRHSTMFGRAIEMVGVPADGATAHVHRLGRAFKTLAAGSARRQALGNPQLPADDGVEGGAGTGLPRRAGPGRCGPAAHLAALAAHASDEAVLVGEGGRGGP
jgi:hypothetical protein